MLAKARQYDDEVVMAFQNGGGIRSGIDAGPITVGEVITVLPFGNTLATMRLTGAEIKAAFEHSISAYPNENGGFLHVAGAKVLFDSTKPAGGVSFPFKCSREAALQTLRITKHILWRQMPSLPKVEMALMYLLKRIMRDG